MMQSPYADQPSEQYDFPMKCPVHRTVLRPWRWTSDFSGNKGKRPRLIYDLFGNIILVQRMYLCVQGRVTHQMTATSPDLMNLFPSWLQMKFPARLYQRSGYSKKLLQYVMKAVT